LTKFILCPMLCGVCTVDNASATACPNPGIHHSTTTSDGCLHRLNVACNTTTAVLVDNSCTHQRKCLQSTNYLRQGGYVFARLCLFVCLSVCVSAR